MDFGQLPNGGYKMQQRTYGTLGGHPVLRLPKDGEVIHFKERELYIPADFITTPGKGKGIAYVLSCAKYVDNGEKLSKEDAAELQQAIEVQQNRIGSYVKFE